MNANANFTIGDQDNPTTSHAFNVTNLDTYDHEFTFDYSGTKSALDDTDANTQFNIYGASGSPWARLANRVQVNPSPSIRVTRSTSDTR